LRVRYRLPSACGALMHPLQWVRMTTLPERMRSLFWETDLEVVDPEAHRDYVLERIMTRGDWEAVRWLRSCYPRDLIAGVEGPFGRGGGRPAWAGPCPPR